MPTKLHSIAIIAAALAVSAGSAFAQQTKFPTKPIRMIVPWTAGSQTDLLARMVAPKLADSLGQQVVVDNRPGAGGTIGAALIATATPDGHTIMMQAAAHAVTPRFTPSFQPGVGEARRIADDPGGDEP